MEKKIKTNVKAVCFAQNSDFHSLVNLQQQKPQQNTKTNTHYVYIYVCMVHSRVKMWFFTNIRLLFKKVNRFT